MPQLPHNGTGLLPLQWQRRIDSCEVASRADLARQLGVSRAHVTQVLNLLELDMQIVAAIAALGDPMPK